MESSTNSVYSQKSPDVFNLKFGGRRPRLLSYLVPRQLHQTARDFKPRHIRVAFRVFSRQGMAATKDDAQIDDAFAVMQRAAKGKAKAITHPEQVIDLPWCVLLLLRLPTLVTHCTCIGSKSTDL